MQRDSVTSNFVSKKLDSLMGSPPRLAAFVRQTQYRELQAFRQQLDVAEIGPFHQPYEAQQRKVRIYRALFFGLSLLFISLLILIMCHKTSWICNMYLGGSFYVKSILIGLTSLLATSSLILGYNLRSEREALNALWHIAKYKIRCQYKKRRTEMGIPPFFPSKEGALLQHTYFETLDKALEHKNGSLALLDQIRRADGIEHTARLQLYNQALSELRDRFNEIIHHFST